jgi:hypothetical protein
MAPDAVRQAPARGGRRSAPLRSLRQVMRLPGKAVVTLTALDPPRPAPGLGDRLAHASEQAASIFARLADLRQRNAQVLAEAERIRQVSADARRQRQASPARRELLQRSETARLLARLETMPVVEQAKGIIMAQSRCGEAEAFDLLRRASQRSNIPVRDLAAQIVAKASDIGR